jgi:hypothetical protein
MAVAEIAQLIQIACQSVAIPDPQVAVVKRSIQSPHHCVYLMGLVGAFILLTLKLAQFATDPVELIPVPTVFGKVIFRSIKIRPHAREEHLGGSKTARNAFGICTITVIIGRTSVLRRCHQARAEAEGC